MRNIGIYYLTDGKRLMSKQKLISLYFYIANYYLFCETTITFLPSLHGSAEKLEWSMCHSSVGNLALNGAKVYVKSTGTAGKGISVDGTLDATASTLRIITIGKQYVYGSLDASPKGIKVEGNLTINSGDIQMITSGGEGSEGIESKAVMTINGGTVGVCSYDDCLNAKTAIDINGGSIYCYSSGNDGIDANGKITITGGTVVSSGTTSPEEGIDCDQNTFTITGGTVLGIGGATSTPTGSTCTQPSVIYSASGSAGTWIHIATTDDTQVMSYAIPRTYSQMTLLFSSASLSKGSSFCISTGGSVSDGTTFYGLNTGGTVVDNTQAATFSTSSMVTMVDSSAGDPGGQPDGQPGGQPGDGWH